MGEFRSGSTVGGRFVWHDGNFPLLAISGISASLDGNRGTASNSKILFVATDTGKIYYDNGGWISVGGGSFLPLTGGTLSGALNMGNANITNVNHIQIGDPGPNEGFEWVGGSGWKIYESPDDLTTNTGGNLQIVTNTTRRLTIDTSGNLTSSGGLTAGGNISTSGNITATGNLTAAKVYNAVYNDYAEYFQRGGEVEPGDVIALDPSTGNYFKSQAKYDKMVVGVCSDEYGHCMGGRGDGHDDENFIAVGMAGRVHVKVTGKVRKGDLLVASNIPGVAMHANRLKLVLAHGCVIGKALGDHDGDSVDKVQALILNK